MQIMRDEQNVKQKKHAYQRKNPRAHELFVQRKQERNAARPKQRFLGVDPQTGLGLGWARP